MIVFGRELWHRWVVLRVTGGRVSLVAGPDQYLICTHCEAKRTSMYFGEIQQAGWPPAVERAYAAYKNRTPTLPEAPPVRRRLIGLDS